MPARMSAGIPEASVRGAHVDDDELRAFMRLQAQQIAAQADQIKELASLVRALAPTQASAVVPTSQIRFGELHDLYFETVAEKSWAKSARDLMVAPMRHFKDAVAEEMKRSDWTYYRDQIRKKQTTRFGGPPSVGTRNLELIRAKIILNWAVTEERISRNPLTGVKPEPKRPPRETTIPDEGVERIQVACDPIMWAFIVVGIDSGMREGEVRGLRWMQIKPGGRVSISWTKAKTNRSRSVRLSQRASDALNALPRGFGGYVFENPDTSLPFSRTWFWERWRSICVDAKLEAAEGDGNVHYHDGRHTFITRTVERGTPLSVAMRAAGHVTLSQVSRYFHLEEHALDEMKARNDAAIGASRIGPKRVEARGAHEKSTADLKKNIDG
jgi:integrase